MNLIKKLSTRSPWLFRINAVLDLVRHFSRMLLSGCGDGLPVAAA